MREAIRGKCVCSKCGSEVKVVLLSDRLGEKWICPECGNVDITKRDYGDLEYDDLEIKK